MNDPRNTLTTLIIEALAPLTVNGVLPDNATLTVLDPVSQCWEAYATGGDAEYFIRVIDQDSIVEVYRGARLYGSYGTKLVELFW